MFELTRLELATENSERLKKSPILSHLWRGMRNLIFPSLFLALLVSVDAQNYRVTDLGVLPGGKWSTAYAINHGGQVVGSSQIVVTDLPGYNGDIVNHAFLYSGGSLKDLGVLKTLSTASRYSVAFSINDHGQVVGYSTTSSDDTFFSHPFLWSAGHMTDLGTLGGIDLGYATWINDRGVIIGQSPIRTGDQHSFIWQGAGLQDLLLNNPSLGVHAYVSSINNRNQICGTLTDSHRSLAFLWENGHITQLLGTLGGTNSYAKAINIRGHIVGVSNLKGDIGSHAFAYGNGTMYDLGPDAATISTAWAINSSDTVVGRCYTQQFTHAFAFIWKPGTQLKDLNQSIDPNSGWVLTWATGINDRSQICGEGFHNGLERAFLLNPLF
jgi:probable HAF family extracellular repeat protein